jgi:DNA-binding GntR family transcriptional regulator
VRFLAQLAPVDRINEAMNTDQQFRLGTLRILAELYYDLGKELHLFRRQGLVQTASMVLSNGEHMRIVEALRDHDRDLSERTMAAHILAGKMRLLERVKGQDPKVSEPGLRTSKENG